MSAHRRLRQGEGKGLEPDVGGNATAGRLLKQPVRLEHLHRRDGSPRSAALQRGQRLVERRERRRRAPPVPRSPLSCGGFGCSVEARSCLGEQTQRMRVVACPGNLLVGIQDPVSCKGATSHRSLHASCCVPQHKL